MVRRISQDQPSPAAATLGSASEQPQPGSEIDLHALARKVYDLLRREARLERERLGPVRRRR